MISIGLGKTYFQNDLLRPEGFRQNVYSLLICTFVINLLSLALPVMTLQVYDRILPNPGTGTLPVLIAGVCLAVFLEVLLRLCRSYIIARSGAAYEHLMACNAMDKILGSNLTKTNTQGIGEHLHHITSVSKLKDFHNGHALVVISEIAFVPLFFGLITYIGGWLAALPALILCAFVAISFKRGARIHNALKQREISDDKRFNFLVESLEGIHSLKAFALERFFERRYEALEEDSCQHNYKVTQENAQTFNISAIFSQIMAAGIISLGAYFVLDGKLTTGALIAILLLSGRMMQPIQRALALWVRYQDYKIARSHVVGILNTPQQVIHHHDDLVDNMPDGRLRLYDVSFRSQNSDMDLLHHINLKMDRGDCVLISGEHGCGKTILLNIISGVYNTTHGEVRIDGQNINTYKAEDLVRHIGYVRSRPLIFRGTIRDNITSFGQVDEYQAREVASLLNVDQDIAKLSGGFDTFLNGNQTDSIPPGLKQRISIVRVLASKPRIILFDNADRALDKDGYASIYSLLARLKGKASMILISDDHNICELADRHYTLEKGLLLESENIYAKGNVSAYKELRL